MNELTWKNLPVKFNDRMKEFKVNSKENTLNSIELGLEIIEDLKGYPDRTSYDFMVNVKLYKNNQFADKDDFMEILEKLVKRDCRENSSIEKVIDYLLAEHFF